MYLCQFLCIYKWIINDIYAFLLIQDAFRQLVLGRITPLSVLVPPHLPTHPHPSTLPCPHFALFSKWIFQGCTHNPIPLRSNCSATPVVHCAGLERNKGAQKGATSEDLVNQGETNSEPRDHGCSVGLVEDLGLAACPMPGSSPSGEWTRDLRTCYLGCLFILCFAEIKGP